jgi:hypothetical protein
MLRALAGEQGGFWGTRAWSVRTSQPDREGLKGGRLIGPPLRGPAADRLRRVAPRLAP